MSRQHETDLPPAGEVIPFPAPGRPVPAGGVTPVPPDRDAGPADETPVPSGTDLEPAVFDYLEGDNSSLEADAMERLAADRQLVAYRHEGFWQCMDTMRDMRLLQTLWHSRNAPWKVWD